MRLWTWAAAGAAAATAALAATGAEAGTPGSSTGTPSFAPLARTNSPASNPSPGGTVPVGPTTSPTPAPIVITMSFFAKTTNCLGTASFNETFVASGAALSCQTTVPSNALVSDPVTAWEAECYIPHAAGSDAAAPALQFLAWQSSPTCPPSVANGAEQPTTVIVATTPQCVTTLFSNYDVYIVNPCPNAAWRAAPSAGVLAAAAAAALAVAAFGAERE